MTKINALDSGFVSVEDDLIANLDVSLRGNVFQPGTSGYENARVIWNAMVDRKPALVIHAKGASDVQQAVRFARKHNLMMSIRSGGHQIAGHAVVDGAVLLDLSGMTSVSVDPGARTARVEPGALLGDVDRETQAHGLIVPLGINSTTGIAGLTLGGGFGWTTRRFGMTIDNLMSAEVVTADGGIVTCSKDQHADLFWALRGGGGNFGVVTSFHFRLHELGPEVMSGLIVHPIADAPSLLGKLTSITDSADDALTVWTVMRKAPPLPFLPEEWHGKEVLIFAACYAGDMAKGEKAMADLRALGDPIVDVIGPHPFVGWQAAFDPLLTPGERNYWKSHDFAGLPKKAIDTLVAAIGNLPDPQSEVFIAHVGGAMARVPVGDTAYPERSAHFIMNVHTRWSTAEMDDACIGWARKLFDDMKPYSTGSAYVNFMPEDEVDRVDNVYGTNMRRLSEIKAKYDPDNFFRCNHNIRPADSAKAAE
ncbi:FAD-binding oxidoreductase [Ruegeria marina]|uniref:FAD/FMN-containing dehydrogenase n=1 Tax=Ruegeria marina TaxID=639004 RepID=A0A1G7EXB7_9RHOB|nr:FAD-binding oxidoreductase [Ruegeria marina]SDE68353.1 FAD/FMN-containing dehydrogenase [Ruegeria marina]